MSKINKVQVAKFAKPRDDEISEEIINYWTQRSQKEWLWGIIICCWSKI
jgi:hypothetical protein